MRRTRYEFKALDAVAAEQKRTPVEQFIQIVKDGGAAWSAPRWSTRTSAFYRQPWVMVGATAAWRTVIRAAPAPSRASRPLRPRSAVADAAQAIRR
jgi:hypothetical protein